MKPLHLSSDLSVPDALAIGPGLAGVFAEHRTACVGCPLARFCTLRDVANTYGIHLDTFTAELEQAAHTDQSLLTGAHDEKYY